MICREEYQRLKRIEDKYWALRDECFGIINKLSQTRIEELPGMVLNVVSSLKKTLDEGEV